VGKFAADNRTILEEPTQAIAGWPIKLFTHWDPGAPYSGKQLSYNNNYSGPTSARSALQAFGNAWGGYLNSNDWMNNGQNMTIRYGYNYETQNAPRPFKVSSYGVHTALLVETNLAVSKYTGKIISPRQNSIGYAIMNLGFRDTKNGKFLTFIGKIFDWRGFTTRNDHGTGFPRSSSFVHRIGGGFLVEGSSRVGTGEMTVASHLGTGTKYCTKMPNSNFSQTAPWENKRYFAYKISRAQFLNIIREANAWLRINEQGTTLYSENVDNYVLKTMDVGIEMTRLTPASDIGNNIEMSYIGDSFKVSTLYSR